MQDFKRQIENRHQDCEVLSITANLSVRKQYQAPDSNRTRSIMDKALGKYPDTHRELKVFLTCSIRLKFAPSVFDILQ